MYVLYSYIPLTKYEQNNIPLRSITYDLYDIVLLRRTIAWNRLSGDRKFITPRSGFMRREAATKTKTRSERRRVPVLLLQWCTEYRRDVARSSCAYFIGLHPFRKHGNDWFLLCLVQFYPMRALYTGRPCPCPFYTRYRYTSVEQQQQCRVVINRKRGRIAKKPIEIKINLY